MNQINVLYTQGIKTILLPTSQLFARSDTTANKTTCGVDSFIKQLWSCGVVDQFIKKLWSCGVLDSQSRCCIILHVNKHRKERKVSSERQAVDKLSTEMELKSSSHCSLVLRLHEGSLYQIRSGRLVPFNKQPLYGVIQNNAIKCRLIEQSWTTNSIKRFIQLLHERHFLLKQTYNYTILRGKGQEQCTT